MPRVTRSKTRATTHRQTPYQTQSASTTGQASNMAAVVSPMMAYGYEQHNPYYLDHQQRQQLSHYHNSMPTPYASMPTPLSGAPAVQQINTPVMPLHSGRSNHTNSGPWSAEADEILLEHASRLKWDVIAERFFGNMKTGNACRKRHARLKKERAEPSRWEREKVQKVIDAYNRHRQQMFTLMAEDINEDWATWQAIEKCCYAQGLKVMTNASPYGHSRRQSRAVSHRSQASINSDDGKINAFEDDPTDDSGIGQVSGGPQLLQIPSQGYTARDSYHDGLTDYNTEAYYREYAGR